MINSNIFSDKTNLEARYFTDYEKLSRIVNACKEIGLRIVLTSGSYDLLHLGHLKYLEKSKEFGDVLVVGIDSDEKIKKRKGPNRPIVSEEERVAMLPHIRHVDVIALKKHDDPKFHLLKIVRPDVLVVSKSTIHENDNLEAMKEFCGRIEILEPQAETSTTARIRLLFVDGVKTFGKKLAEEFSVLVEKTIKEFHEEKK